MAMRRARANQLPKVGGANLARVEALADTVVPYRAGSDFRDQIADVDINPLMRTTRRLALERSSKPQREFE